MTGSAPTGHIDAVNDEEETDFLLGFQMARALMIYLELKINVQNHPDDLAERC